MYSIVSLLSMCTKHESREETLSLSHSTLTMNNIKKILICSLTPVANILITSEIIIGFLELIQKTVLILRIHFHLTANKLQSPQLLTKWQNNKIKSNGSKVNGVSGTSTIMWNELWRASHHSPKSLATCLECHVYFFV